MWYHLIMTCHNLKKEKSSIIQFFPPVLLLFLFLAGCAGTAGIQNAKLQNTFQNEIATHDKLYRLLDEIQTGLARGDSGTLRRSLTASPKNLLIRKRLREIPFERLQVFLGEPEFDRDQASLVMGLNYLTHTEYYDIRFVLKNGRWKIRDFTKK